jgi:hypothetical protein
LLQFILERAGPLAREDADARVVKGEALRDRFLVDPRGRRVRKRLSVRLPVERDDKEVQLGLWDDTRTASRAFLNQALLQLRDAVQADVNSLSATVEYVNTEVLLTRDEEAIQLDLDFRPDEPPEELAS